ncbi:hypothetical protein QBC33DRAFT_538795 [Phialemonium atrogriseum]|uniref:Uncharacterized protein n=1 Tax=Phialemonium atrogriseum TaxID=1093897 RepID=A0AAJ0C1G6_9PEZI|nr:uncharacterized protein QBC33DRAFT_538795 [Phialemonium atrogriseum]KAK1766984.1 hypothetical protein QBC33DRAFT_538795 [Phialemonium atrogriseum]
MFSILGSLIFFTMSRGRYNNKTSAIGYIRRFQVGSRSHLGKGRRLEKAEGMGYTGHVLVLVSVTFHGEFFLFPGMCIYVRSFGEYHQTNSKRVSDTLPTVKLWQRDKKVVWSRLSLAWLPRREPTWHLLPPGRINTDKEHHPQGLAVLTSAPLSR